MSRVLVYLHNAGRSQMSQALFNRAAGGRHDSRSAGSTPAVHVHPEVVTVTDEFGFDLRAKTPKQLTTETAEWADGVVTMGCGDACPFIPGRRYLDWKLGDPKGPSLDAVRTTRDESARLIDELVDELDTTTATSKTPTRAADAHSLAPTNER